MSDCGVCVAKFLWDFLHTDCSLQPLFVNSDFDDLSYGYDSFGCLVAILGGCGSVIIPLLLIVASASTESQKQDLKLVQEQTMAQKPKNNNKHKLDLVCEEFVYPSGKYEGETTMRLYDRFDFSASQLGKVLKPTYWERVLVRKSLTALESDLYAYEFKNDIICKDSIARGLHTIKQGQDGKRYADITAISARELSVNNLQEQINSAGTPIERVRPPKSNRAFTQMRVKHRIDHLNGPLPS